MRVGLTHIRQRRMRRRCDDAGLPHGKRLVKCPRTLWTTNCFALSGAFIVVDSSEIAGLLTPHEVKEIEGAKWPLNTLHDVRNTCECMSPMQSFNLSFDPCRFRHSVLAIIMLAQEKIFQYVPGGRT